MGSGGVVISGTMVWINERGEPGEGKVAKPEWPFDKQEPEEPKTGVSEDDHSPAAGLGMGELEEFMNSESKDVLT